MSKGGYKAKYIVSFAKRGLDWDTMYLNLESETGVVDTLSMDEVDKHLFQYKFPSEAMAHKVLGLVTTSTKVALESLLRLLSLWGQYRSFVQVASFKQ